MPINNRSKMMEFVSEGDRRKSRCKTVLRITNIICKIVQVLCFVVATIGIVYIAYHTNDMKQTFLADITTLIATVQDGKNSIVADMNNITSAAETFVNDMNMLTDVISSVSNCIRKLCGR